MLVHGSSQPTWTSNIAMSKETLPTAFSTAPPISITASPSNSPCRALGVEPSRTAEPSMARVPHPGLRAPFLSRSGVPARSIRRPTAKASRLSLATGSAASCVVRSTFCHTQLLDLTSALESKHAYLPNLLFYVPFSQTIKILAFRTNSCVTSI